MTDETKGTGQDTSPGKTGQSPGSKSGTPKDKGTLFTDAQIAKIKSDAAAMGQGRAEKVAVQEKAALTQELQNTKSRLDALERDVNEARLAEARGDSDKMRAYQADQTLAKRLRAVEDKEREQAQTDIAQKAEREAIDKDKGKVAVAVLAATHGLEPEDLESFGITDYEVLEKVAIKLAASKPESKGKGEEGEEGEEGGGEEAWEADTGETTGGKGALDALAKANEDFSAGKITEKQLQEAASKVK